MAKLTKEKLIAIVECINNGYGSRKIAKMFNITSHNANSIKRKYELHGLDGLVNRENRTYDSAFKYEMIQKIYNGTSINTIAIELNVSRTVVSSWVKKYEQLGYNGLIDNRGRPGVTKVGRPRKNQTKPVTQQTPLTDPEREELNELRKRNRRLEMELEATKKLQALVQERIKRQTPKK